MKILIIEDENELARAVHDYFKPNGIQCEMARNLLEARNKIAEFEYDCILLDLMLPDGEGFTFLQELRKMGKTDGVIIISAKETLDSRLEGLNLGADDYLTKPFYMSELLARVQALVRRKNHKGRNIVSFHEISIDYLSKSVRVHDQKIRVTKTEVALLLFLIGNSGRVLSKGAIAEHLSGDMADMLDNHDFVYAHIKNLKKKMSRAGAGEYIKTIYGLGYKWGDD